MHSIYIIRAANKNFAVHVTLPIATFQFCGWDASKHLQNVTLMSHFFCQFFAITCKTPRSLLCSETGKLRSETAARVNDGSESFLVSGVSSVSGELMMEVMLILQPPQLIRSYHSAMTPRLCAIAHQIINRSRTAASVALSSGTLGIRGWRHVSCNSVCCRIFVRNPLTDRRSLWVMITWLAACFLDGQFGKVCACVEVHFDLSPTAMGSFFTKLRRSIFDNLFYSSPYEWDIREVNSLAHPLTCIHVKPLAHLGKIVW